MSSHNMLAELENHVEKGWRVLLVLVWVKAFGDCFLVLRTKFHCIYVDWRWTDGQKKIMCSYDQSSYQFVNDSGSHLYFSKLFVLHWKSYRLSSTINNCVRLNWSLCCIFGQKKILNSITVKNFS